MSSAASGFRSASTLVSRLARSQRLWKRPEYYLMLVPPPVSLVRQLSRLPFIFLSKKPSRAPNCRHNASRRGILTSRYMKSQVSRSRQAYHASQSVSLPTRICGAPTADCVVRTKITRSLHGPKMVLGRPIFLCISVLLSRSSSFFEATFKNFGMMS